MLTFYENKDRQIELVDMIRVVIKSIGCCREFTNCVTLSVLFRDHPSSRSVRCLQVIQGKIFVKKKVSIETDKRSQTVSKRIPSFSAF